jgi:hypothetical protein
MTTVLVPILVVAVIAGAVWMFSRNTPKVDAPKVETPPVVEEPIIEEAPKKKRAPRKPKTEA